MVDARVADMTGIIRKARRSYQRISAPIEPMLPVIKYPTYSGPRSDLPEVKAAVDALVKTMMTAKTHCIGVYATTLFHTAISKISLADFEKKNGVAVSLLLPETKPEHSFDKTIQGKFCVTITDPKLPLAAAMLSGIEQIRRREEKLYTRTQKAAIAMQNINILIADSLPTLIRAGVETVHWMNSAKAHVGKTGSFFLSQPLYCTDNGTEDSSSSGFSSSEDP